MSDREKMVHCLIELGWSKAELARRLGLHSNTVSQWGDDVPGYALAYLDLAVAVVSFSRERIEWARSTDGRRR